jgi:predicted RNA-binding protein with PIN domain
MRWLVDGYNVIRRSPELHSREREGLAAGRAALLTWLRAAHRASGDRFTVVFDGAGPASAGPTGAAPEGAGVAVVFSTARESADRVLASLAGSGGGAVVSSDREVQRAAARAGAVAVSAEDFLARLPRLGPAAPGARAPAGAAPLSGEREGPEAEGWDKDEADEAPAGPRKGNPRRLPRRRRAAERALRRLGPGPGRA